MTKNGYQAGNACKASDNKWGGSYLESRKLLIVLASIVLLFMGVSLAEKSLGRMALNSLKDEADNVKLAITADEITVKAFRWSPGIVVSNLVVAAPGFDPLIEDASFSVKTSWRSLLFGSSVAGSVEVDSLRVNLLVDETGKKNWTAVLAAFQQQPSGDETPDFQLERLHMRSGQIEYLHDQLGHAGEAKVTSDWLRKGAILDARVSIDGDLNYYPLSIDGSISLDPSRAAEGADGSLSLVARLADLSLHMDGTSRDSESLAGAEIRLALNGIGLSGMMKNLDLWDTDVSSVRATAAITYESNDHLQGSAEMAFDKSLFEAQFNIAGLLGGDPVRQVDVEISSDEVFLDALLDTSQSDDKADSRDSAGVLLSTDQWVYTPLFDGTDVNAVINVNTLYKGGFRSHDLELSLIKVGDSANLMFAATDAGKGELESDLTLEKSGSMLDGKLTIQAKGVPIGQIMSLADIPEGAASGRISGDAKFWFSGRSMSELGSSLDGGLFLLVEEGTLDSLFVEMAGVDLMESINLVLNRDLQHTEIRCGFVDLQVESGLVTLKDFIIDSEDSIFIASGEVDLGNEMLDLKFSPHPRDGSFFAATTPVHLRGPISSPSVRPGSRLYSRVAVAAAMAALAGPAALVLPFIELGSGEEQSYCTELFGP